MRNEKLNPIHYLLKKPIVYDIVQGLLNKKKCNDVVFTDFVDVQPSDRILDFGCGSARYRKHIPTQHYVGIDFNQAHIDNACELYPDDTFICGNIVDYQQDLGQFDKILMMGVLHHLSDDEVKTVLSACKRFLKPGGKLYAVDPVYEQKQNPIAVLLNKLDQGNHVRFADHYQQLATTAFTDIKIEIRRDLLRLPYSRHLMMAGMIETGA